MVENNPTVEEKKRQIVVCKNCGHERSFHSSLGGVSFCDAMLSRVPRKMCDCKEFK